MNASEITLLEILKGFKGLKSNVEKAISQISDDQLHFHPGSESNSIAIIMKHMNGNMISRFTDFLIADGEKPWRDRDKEFINEKLTRDQIIDYWEKGWDCLFNNISSLKEADILRSIFIRGEEHTVIRALLRQLSHYAYHAGQIVFICKMQLDKDFKTLSIARGESSKYVSHPPTINSR